MLIALATQSTPAEPAIPFGGLSGVLLTAGVVLLSIWIVGSVHRNIRRRNLAEQTPRERIDGLKSRGAARQSVDAYMADAEELTRRLAAHLDNKAARLERLIADADERLERLDRPDRTREPRPARPRNAPFGGGYDPPTESPPRDPLSEKVYSLADQGHSALSIARELDEQTGKIELILALRSV